MSRWVEFLSVYTYQLVYKFGKAIGHAATLSCCPLPQPVDDPAPTSSVLLVDSCPSLVTSVDVQRHSLEDPLISQVLDWVRGAGHNHWLRPSSSRTNAGNLSCQCSRVACYGAIEW